MDYGQEVGPSPGLVSGSRVGSRGGVRSKVPNLGQESSDYIEVVVSSGVGNMSGGPDSRVEN